MDHVSPDEGIGLASEQMALSAQTYLGRLVRYKLNIASALTRSGKFDDSILLNESVLGDMEKLYGENHEETIEGFC